MNLDTLLSDLFRDDKCIYVASTLVNYLNRDISHLAASHYLQMSYTEVDANPTGPRDYVEANMGFYTNE